MSKFIFSVLLFTTSFVACKRFDSNIYNQKMIQGDWALNGIWSKKDSTSISIKNSSILIFVEDICTEHYKDSLNREVKYKFEINNYHLRLIDSLQKKNIFLISKLVKDSLILENDVYYFTYISTKE